MTTAKHQGLRWFFLLALLTAGCQAEMDQPPPPLRPVRYQEVASTGGARVRSFSGVAQADVQSQLSFRVSGNVRRVLVETGDRIEEGQLIAEMDDTDFEYQVQEAEAALSLTEAQARSAEANYERVRGLYENRNASKSDLDGARAAAESARAQIDQTMNRLEQARAQLSYTRLRAPFRGSVASVQVEVNENVRAGQTVAVLTAGSRPEVQVAVPESLIGQIQVRSEVEVTFGALPERSFHAVVTQVGIAATGLATTFPVTVQLQETAPDVRSGMAADVAFRFESPDTGELFLVPPQAVLEDRQGRFVFVVEETGSGEGVVRRKEVTVGELTGEGLEVLEGLEEGDRVVTAGFSQIVDGLEVRVTGGAEGGQP